MRVLSIETAAQVGSVAVVDAGIVLAESSARLRAAHSEALLPMVHEVLTRAGLSLAEIDTLAVGIGPGSFTGVRIGVATAKGLRAATGKRLLGVGTLDALCAGAVGARGLVCAALDAHRDELFAALYRVDAQGRTQLIAPANATPEVLGERVREAAKGEPVLAIGDLSPALWTRFGAGSGTLEVLPSVAGSPLARFVAHEAAAGRALRDDDDDALEPLYVRPSDAKLPAKKQVGDARGEGA